MGKTASVRLIPVPWRCGFQSGVHSSWCGPESFRESSTSSQGFFHPQQLSWISFSFILLVSSSCSDPTSASRPSLLHRIYGVALERKQAWGGGAAPPIIPTKQI